MTLSRRDALNLSAGLLAAGAAGAVVAAGPAHAASEALQQAFTAAGRARAAYHLALESGKLPALALELAERIFQRHQANEEALRQRLRPPHQAGPAPAGLNRPEVQAAIAAADTPAAMLRLLRDVEVQALAAVLAQRTNDPEAGVLLAGAAADGAMHWTLLNHVLGEPLPAQGLAAGGSLPMAGAL